MASEVTLSELARRLGVSPSTVSRALAGHPRISRQMQARVKALAGKEGYRPDPLMVTLAARRWRRRPGEAGAVMAWVSLGRSAAKKHAPPLAGARQAAEALGYRLEVFVVSDAVSARATERILRARGIRGVIVRYDDPEARLPDWDWSAFAPVCCGEPPEDARRMDVVELAVEDNHQRIARELLARGLRRPGVVLLGKPWLRSEHRRLGGLITPFLEAAAEPPPFRWWDQRDSSELKRWLTAVDADCVVGMTAAVFHALVPGATRKRDQLPFVCMQLRPGDAAELAGVESNFTGMGEVAARHCEMLIRQNRTGLPDDPVLTLVASRWKPGSSLATRPPTAR